MGIYETFCKKFQQVGYPILMFEQLEPGNVGCFGSKNVSLKLFLVCDEQDRKVIFDIRFFNFVSVRTQVISNKHTDYISPFSKCV